LTADEPLTTAPGPVEVLAPPRDERGPEAPRLRVLHVLAISVPHLNGYTMRSKYLVDAQRTAGRHEPAVVTSPFYPREPAAIGDADIAGTRYFRVPHPVDAPGAGAAAWTNRLAFHGRRGIAAARRAVRAAWRRARAWALPPSRAKAWRKTWLKVRRNTMRSLRELTPAPLRRAARAMRSRWSREAPPEPAPRGNGPLSWPGQAARWLVERVASSAYRVDEALLLRRFERGIVAAARAVRAEVIHAHSPYRCALAAAGAARRLGLPMVYEVRGLWEESGVATGRFEEGDSRYRAWRRREEEAMRRADALVCICEQLRQELIGRGVPAERIVVCPNAVDPEVFRPVPDAAPRPPDVRAAAAALRGLRLGYIGSLRKLEGVDDLVRGAAELVRRGCEVSLLVVGSGPDLAGLRRLADRLGIGDRSVFTGRVPHDHTPYYYDLIDAFVISRPDVRVARLVTPLKPLEAMAMGRALVMSDLPALRELAPEGDAALYYRAGDPGALADVCERLAMDPGLRRRLGEGARCWVCERRTWRAAIAELPRAYACAARNAGAAW
jgi:glycosyltransferase involved in cell wall biosynthesis